MVDRSDNATADGAALPDTVVAFWRAALARHSKRTLVRYRGISHSFAAIDARARDLSAGLLAQGAGKGSRIALLMPNGPDWIASWLAITRIGAIAIELSTFFAARELAYALRHSDAATLLAAPGYLRHDYCARLEEALPSLASAPRPLTLRECPFLRSIWLTEPSTRSWSSGSLDDLASAGRASPFAEPDLFGAVEQEVHSSDLAVQIYTSGSTAMPKGVLHTHGTVAHKSTFSAMDNGILPVGLGPEDRVIITSPFFWVGGFLQLTGAIHHGACVICHDEHSPTELIDVIRDEGATQITGTEGILRSLLAAAPDAPELIGTMRPQNVFQWPFFRTLRGEPAGCDAQSIGMTETFGGHTGLEHGAPLPTDKRGSNGQVLPFMELRIADPETGEVLPPGTPGELQVRGRWLMAGMHKRERSELLVADGFYPTGDRCVLDGEGYLFFISRIGNMIKTSDANVAPDEVEVAIREHPEVLDVAVIGVPDPKLGQMVVAVVARRDGSTLDDEALRAWLKPRLSSFKVPKRVYFRAFDEFPRTASDKIIRPALLDQLLALPS